MTRHGDGDPMLPADPYRRLVNECWRRYTLGELAALSGVSPASLHRIKSGESAHVQGRTAVRLSALKGLVPEASDG
jgi:hypothetical protein